MTLRGECAVWIDTDLVEYVTVSYGRIYGDHHDDPRNDRLDYLIYDLMAKVRKRKSET